MGQNSRDDGYDQRFRSDTDRLARSLRDEDPHDSRMASRASMDAAFGRRIGTEASLRSIMTSRTASPEARRAANNLFWKSVRNR